MTEEVLALVEEIHATDQQIVIATAGAGHTVLEWLLNVPGASRTMLEAIIPYSREAMEDFIGENPDKSVSKETAWLMGSAALSKAKKQTSDPIGIGCTATIKTVQPKRGEHRAIISVWKPKSTKTYSLTLLKDARTREEEEELVSYILLIALCQAMNISPSPLLIATKLIAGDIIEVSDLEAPPKMIKERE